MTRPIIDVVQYTILNKEVAIFNFRKSLRYQTVKISVLSCVVSALKFDSNSFRFIFAISVRKKKIKYHKNQNSNNQSVCDEIKIHEYFHSIRNHIKIKIKMEHSGNIH